MMLYLLFTILLLFTIIALKSSSKYFISPFLVICASFLFAVFICVINPQWILKISGGTFLTILLGLLSFGVGQLLVKKFTIKKIKYPRASCEYEHEERIYVTYWILAIQLLLTVIYTRFIVQIGGGISLKVINNARTWLLYNDMPNIYGHVELLSFAIAAVYVYLLSRNLILKKRRNGAIRSIVIITLYLIVQIVSSSRSGFIYFFGYTVTIVVYFYQKQMYKSGFSKRFQQRKTIKIIIGISIAVLLMFVILGNLTGKTLKMGVINMISTYFGGSIYNLNYYIANKDTFLSPSFGYFTLPIINSLKHAMGIGVATLDTYYFPMNIISTKYGNNFSPTNLYTCFTKPLTDFNILGGIIYFFLLGMLYGVFYRCMAKSKDAGMLLVYYGYIIMPLVGASAEYLFGSFLFSPATLYRVIYLYIIFKMCVKKVAGYNTKLYNGSCEHG